MRNFFSLVIVVSLLYSVSECRSRKGSKNLMVRKGKASRTKHASNTNTTQAIPGVNTTTASPTTDDGLVVINLKPVTKKPTKKTIYLSTFTYRGRKCCKQGYKAGRRGYNCNLNRHYAYRVTNMEHRARMKFQGRPMNSVDRKLIKRITRFCIKTGLKSLFGKCCRTTEKK